MNTFSKLLSGRSKRTTSKGVEGTDSPLPQSVLSMTGQLSGNNSGSDAASDLDGAASSESMNRKAGDLLSRSSMGLAAGAGSGSQSGIGGPAATPRRPFTAAVFDRRTDGEPFPEASAGQPFGDDGRRSFDGSLDERTSIDSDRSSIDERRPPVEERRATAAEVKKSGTRRDFG